MAAYQITTETPTITVRIMGGKDFNKGVTYAKKFNGKFNASTKTWTIPTAQVAGWEPWRMGWVRVADAAPAANVCRGCHDPKCRDGECGFGVDYIEGR